MKTNYVRPFLALLLVGSLAACDSLNPSPEDSVPAESVLTSAQGAEATLTGAYSTFQVLYEAEVIFADLASDDAQHSGSYPSWAAVDNFSMVSSNAESRDHWINAYDVINITNDLIADVPGIEDPEFTVDEGRRNAIVGEALALRAMTYHLLIRWFGIEGGLGVPLVLDPTVAISGDSDVSRASTDAVYEQIIADLTRARGLVASGSSAGYIDQAVVNAMLARVYLYREQYGNAAESAQNVISGDEEFSLATLEQVYRNQNSSEAIFELQFNSEDQNDIPFFAFPSGRGGRYEYAPTAAFATSFEASDLRIPYNADTLVVSGVANPTIVKYSDVVTYADDLYFFRLPEVFFIRAEALAMQNESEDEALDLVNQVRARAGLDDVSAEDFDTDEEQLDVILRERYHELAFEGHRRHDLVRTGRAVDVLGAPSLNLLRWPIPQRDIDSNPNLEQNPAY